MRSGHVTWFNAGLGVSTELVPYYMVGKKMEIPRRSFIHSEGHDTAPQLL